MTGPTDADCGAPSTWTPDPRRQYTWPSGRRTGPGLIVESVDDATGSMVLLGRSKTTMRWSVRIMKRAHGA